MFDVVDQELDCDAPWLAFSLGDYEGVLTIEGPQVILRSYRGTVGFIAAVADDRWVDDLMAIVLRTGRASGNIAAPVVVAPQAPVRKLMPRVSAAVVLAATFIALSSLPTAEALVIPEVQLEGHPTN